MSLFHRFSRDRAIRPAATILFSAIVTGAMFTISACATGSAGLGEQAGTVQLPSGLRMIASQDAECDDSVHVGAGPLINAQLGPELFVEPGQNATFEINDAPVNWVCIDGDSRDYHEFECDSDASYVRLTRAIDGGELLLECFA